MKKHIVALITVAVISGLALPRAAAEPGTTGQAPAAEAKAGNKKRDTYPLYGQVVAVTDSLLTVKSSKDAPERKYDINKETKIQNGDKPATIADVKTGSWVGGRVKSAASGNPLLLSLNLGVKQKQADEKAPK